MELKKIKFKDLSENQVLNVEGLSKILGGASMNNGCGAAICASNRNEWASKLCQQAVCVNSIDSCFSGT